VEKLRYLLSGVVQKNTKQLRRLRVLQRQLKTAKSENHELRELNTALKIEKESEHMYKFERDFEKLRADYNRFAFTELFQLIQNEGFVNSEYFLSQIESFHRDFRQIKSDEVQTLNMLINAKNDELQLQTRKTEEIREELDMLLAAPISKDVEKTIVEKDQTITKLRNLVQKYMKSEMEKQQQIQEQQDEIQRLSKTIAIQQDPKNHASIDEIARLELEIGELRSQVVKSQHSQQMEKKCEQLASMLDKSQRLYSELSEKYAEISKKVGKRKSGSNCIEISQLFEKALPLKNERVGGKVTEATLASLKKTILQYFLTDVGNQENLVPVILELMGCTAEQSKAAMRNFKSNQQFVNRAGGIFGIFG
jgi:hypothetical protein